MTCERCQSKSVLRDVELLREGAIYVMRCLSCSHIQGARPAPHEEPKREVAGLSHIPGMAGADAYDRRVAERAAWERESRARKKQGAA